MVAQAVPTSAGCASDRLLDLTAQLAAIAAECRRVEARVLEERQRLEDELRAAATEVPRDPYLVTVARAAELVGISDTALRKRFDLRPAFRRYVVDHTTEHMMVNTARLRQVMTGEVDPETMGADEISKRRQRRAR